MVNIEIVQKNYEKRMRKRKNRKMFAICLSPKKAREDVDFINYLYAGKLSVLKTHIRSKKR